jgi:hypothetical protein
MRSISALLRPARHDRSAQFGMRCQHAEEADQVVPPARYQRGQALHEFLRLHDDLGRTVAIGAFQLQHDLAFAIAAQALVRDRGAGDVAAQPFECFALVAGYAHYNESRHR